MDMILQGNKGFWWVTLAISTPAWAQQLPPDETILGAYGQTQLQIDTGNAVNTTCLGLVDDEASGVITPSQQRLLGSCSRMVFTAIELDGGVPPLDLGLGLTADELAAGLQQLATEEFANTESVANEIATNRHDPVITRLTAVRSGISGFTAQGLDPAMDEAIADNQWLDQMSNMRGGSAGDDGPGSAWSGFLNFGYGFGERDRTERSNEFKFDSYNVTLGADYRFNSNFVLGAAINYYKVDSEFDDVPTVSGGDIDTEGLGASLYGTYYGEKFYVDGLLGYAVSEYDLRRNVVVPSNTDVTPLIGEAKGSTDSTDFTASVGAGAMLGRGAFGWGPYARLTYTQVDIDRYQETGLEALGLNLDVRKQDWKSLISALGANFSYTFSQNYGVIAPNLRLGWIHQFENDAQDIIATYTEDPRQFALVARTDDPDRDYGELGIGVSSVFKGGGQVFFSYDTLIGFKNLTSNLFTLGGRLEF